MLFKKDAYRTIGGHLEVSSEVVEDMALAYKVKKAGMKLTYLLGIDLIKLKTCE